MYRYSNTLRFGIRWIAPLCIFALLFLPGSMIVAAQENNEEQDIQVELEEALKEAQNELGKALEQAGVGLDEAINAFTEAMKNIDFEKTMEAAMQAAGHAMRLADVEFGRVMEEMEQEMERAMRGFRESREAVPPASPQAPRWFHRPPSPSAPHAPFAPKIDGLLGQFQGEIVSDTQEMQVAIHEGMPVMVKSEFTDVTVLPSGDSSLLLIKAEISGGGPTQEEAQRMIDNLALEIEETPESVNIIIRQNEEIDQSMGRDRTGRFHSAKLHLMVPHASPLQIDNSFGAVHIAERQGGIICKNEFGPMLISDVQGDLSAHNEYGPLNIQGHRGAASIVCKFGALNLERIEGAYSVTTEYGNASIKSIAPNATLTGSFQFGDAHIHLPRDYAGYIDAQTSMGSLRAPSELATKREMFSESLHARLNEGEGRLQLNGNFGVIHLHMDDA